MTMILEPRDKRIQAVFLRGHMRLLAKGLRHSKMSTRSLLDAAGRITGQKYKRGQYQAAADDLDAIINKED